jgi:GDP-mannose 6-dehydrogenase
MLDLNLPVLEAILPSNELQIRHAIDLIANAGKKRIGILGFSFKAGTDDLRNSPVVEVIETLLGKGYTLRIFDESVSLAKLCGANKNFIEREIPHVASLMCQSLDEVLEVSDVLVIGTKSPLFAGICNRLRSDQIVIDLVRITNSYGVNDNGHGTNGNGHGNGNEGRYYGLCW